MRSKLILTRFYLSHEGLPMYFGKAPSMYDKKGKCFHGWFLLWGEWGPGSRISRNWLDTKLINNSELVLERNIFA